MTVKVFYVKATRKDGETIADFEGRDLQYSNELNYDFAKQNGINFKGDLEQEIETHKAIANNKNNFEKYSVDQLTLNLDAEHKNFSVVEIKNIF